MNKPAPHPDQTATAPQPFRDALAELVQVGLTVARLIGRVAQAETALADVASQAGAAEGVSALATSLAEAIEADRAAAAAAEARQTVVARAEALAAAFGRVSRSVRLTVMLAERLDRGWARGGAPDDRHAKALRQIARGIEDATGREAEGERDVSLTGALTEREAPDTEDECDDRPLEEVMGIICRALGLDPVRMRIVRSPLPNVISLAEANAAVPLTGGGADWAASPPQRRPDG